MTSNVLSHWFNIRKDIIRRNAIEGRNVDDMVFLCDIFDALFV